MKIFMIKLANQIGKVHYTLWSVQTFGSSLLEELINVLTWSATNTKVSASSLSLLLHLGLNHEGIKGINSPFNELDYID